MAGHTPGPWTTEPSPLVERFHVVVTVDRYQSLYKNGKPRGQPYHYPITGPWGIVEPADARLVAAAPDLLAACRTLAEFLDNLAPAPGDAPDVLEVAYRAIARAEGTDQAAEL